jgi:glycerophosphoryl diester phosphodiesterase
MRQESGSNKGVHLIAHRGWNRFFPENSLPAFAAAVAAGADEIEFDVHVSKDQVPFICHDRTTTRVSNLEGDCAAFTMSELRHALIRLPSGEHIQGLGFPTLLETLQLFGNQIGMNIHVKTTGEDDIVLRQLNAYVEEHNLEGIYIAGDHKVLTAATRICPDIPRCCLAGDGDGAALLENALKFNCQRLQFRAKRYQQIDVDGALAHGLITNLFYADDPEEAEQAITSGILGLLTNDIGTIRQHLIQKGIL